MKCTLTTIIIKKAPYKKLKREVSNHIVECISDIYKLFRESEVLLGLKVKINRGR
jgi:hypothetical protein